MTAPLLNVAAVVGRAFRTQPFRRARTQTEVRNSDFRTRAQT
jgi:hypothetical protein